MTKNIFTVITISSPRTINKLNIETTFKIAWAGFMQLEEITYIK